MATQPLIDFERTDLSRVIIPPEEIRKICKQRGRLELLHGILHFDLEGKLIVGFNDLRESDWWAADHIPGRPIFPGVLMIEGAAQLCTYDFIQRHPELGDKFVGYGGLNRTRFRGLVTPGQRITWVARAGRLRQSVFTYDAQAFCDQRLVFESEILGVVV